MNLDVHMLNREVYKKAPSPSSNKALRGGLDVGDGDFLVAFCILRNITFACPDPPRSNLCALPTQIYLATRVQSRFISLRSE
jgi:hypothetical protein